MAFIQKNNIGLVVCDECNKTIEWDIDYPDYKDEYMSKHANLCDDCLEHKQQQLNKEITE